MKRQHGRDTLPRMPSKALTFHFERRSQLGALSSTGDRGRLAALAALIAGGLTFDPDGWPIGVARDGEIEVWRSDDGAWDVWITASGELVVFPHDGAVSTNHTIQGGFELEDAVSAATRAHVCRGDDCWGCSIDRA